MKLSRRTLNVIHAATLAGCLVILIMTFYNWRLHARLDFGSLVVVALILGLVVLQRAGRRHNGDSA